MSLRTRILLGTVSPLVGGMVVLLLVSALSFRSQTEHRIEATRALYEASVIDRLAAQVDQAQAALETAIAAGEDPHAALRRVADLGHGTSYVWVHSIDRGRPQDVTMVMHPVQPSLNGSDLSGVRDLERVQRIFHEGKIVPTSDPSVEHVEEMRLFVDMNRAVLESDDGAAVVRYYWQKPGVPADQSDVGFPKVSYVKHVPKHGWVLGSGEYADFIDAEVALHADQMWASGRRLTLWIVGLSLGIVGVLVAVTIKVAHRIVEPIRRTTDTLKDIAEGGGDLTVRLDEDVDGEIGEMSRHFNRFVAKLQEIIADVGRATDEVGQASVDIADTSTRMSGAAQHASNQSQVVSAAAEQISTSITAVAAAIEELDASVKEIAQHSASAANQATHAVDTVEAANRTVSALTSSSERIGDVIQLIASIAGQTNLLALNATIEAARAGEAGRGFAVVANEVKELAKGTAEATGEITAQITSLQEEIRAASSAIGSITDTIRRISDAQLTIAGAVEEQSVTVAELAGNVSEVSTGGTEIARNIATVAGVASDTSDGAAGLRGASERLKDMSDGLRSLVGRFRV